MRENEEKPTNESRLELDGVVTPRTIMEIVSGDAVEIPTCKDMDEEYSDCLFSDCIYCGIEGIANMGGELYAEVETLECHLKFLLEPKYCPDCGKRLTNSEANYITLDV